MEQLFSLDLQLLHDTILLALAVLFLFTIMTYLLFNPVRRTLKGRQERIRNDIDNAKKNKEEASDLKREYRIRLKGVEKEAEKILSEARQKALISEAKITEEAREEAARIIKRAKEEALLEKKRIMDEVKQEVITIASMMAGKVVAAAIDISIQDILVEETIKEIGENTWQS